MKKYLKFLFNLYNHLNLSQHTMKESDIIPEFFFFFDEFNMSENDVLNKLSKRNAF